MEVDGKREDKKEGKGVIFTARIRRVYGTPWLYQTVVTFTLHY